MNSFFFVRRPAAICVALLGTTSLVTPSIAFSQGPARSTPASGSQGGQMLEAGPNAVSSCQMSTANWSWAPLPRMKGDHYYDGMVSAMRVAPGATTHGNDMHQRAIKLKVSPPTHGLSARIPASSALVPLGHYMLFVQDSAGIPSVAKFVRVS